MVVKAPKADARVPSSRPGSGAWCISVRNGLLPLMVSLEHEDYFILCNRKGADYRRANFLRKGGFKLWKASNKDRA